MLNENICTIKDDSVEKINEFKSNKKVATGKNSNTFLKETERQKIKIAKADLPKLEQPKEKK